MEMHALIEEIAVLLLKIKSGEATLGELEAFAAATNQLNERAIILRYKAYESSVYGNPVTAVSKEEVELESIAEPEIELENSEVQEEASFDLFAMDLDEEVEDEIAFEMGVEESAKVEKLPTSEVEIAAEDEVVPFAPPVVEEEKEEIRYEANMGSPVVPEPEPIFVASPEIGQNLHSIYGKLNNNDGTLAARLMSVRLETLKGAFGFNERLQIIQELFNGSNDEFNNLIEQLETIPSKEEARSLVSSYANKYHWDSESQLAIELIQKVERKYA
ncbi:hypothetical protein [Fluviicola taffensis]|uniref:Uncharacterized protein n=1 Tax=Fluviicola taffensis (strain DSM 16823 / NCIMB 13979 / RW262) TaxID=755732 RepID=F2IAK7_FLUTR|nr:hypothetical protein [Fluviicola taffensis]AEA43143.1 hypothetical protein Fluta_1147 [Fluviicola taffensis DSM 16823]